MKKLGWLIILCMMLMSCDATDSSNTQNDVIDTLENKAQVVNNTTIENDTDGESTETQKDTQEATTETEEVVEVVEEVVEVVEVIDYNALYNEYKVNESGQTMVIMYHNLAEKEGTYASTPELFRADLERLYNEGYRTISMSDLVNNNIDIPIGTTPVVLTFDDGSNSNFYYEEDGTIGKDSVVGILNEFSKTHEGFGRNAIFYLYGTAPFRDKELITQKLEYLVSNGYEIGSHSFGHDDLKTLGADGIQKTLAKNEAFIQTMLPDHKMIHLSLPYGKRPNEALEANIYAGSYEDVSYEIVSAVNVGWNPIASPATSKFDPTSINRITCGSDEAELNYWLDYFLNKPERRYYSDGQAGTIVVPVDKLETVNDKYLEKVITYEESEEN